MLSQSEVKKIEALITACEQKTDAEFVPVVVKQSDLYPAAHFRLALFLGLLIPIGLYYLPWTFYDPIWYLYAQLPALIVGYLLGYHKKLKRLFSTRFEMTEEVRQCAQEFFLTNGLHATTKRSAILIFVSLLERRIEIIADTNVINALSTGERKTLLRDKIKLFQKEMKTLPLHQALEDLISALAQELTAHLPKTSAESEIADQMQLGLKDKETPPSSLLAPSTPIDSQEENGA